MTWISMYAPKTPTIASNHLHVPHTREPVVALSMETSSSIVFIRPENYARVRSISTETELSGSPTGAQGFSSLTRTPYALG